MELIYKDNILTVDKITAVVDKGAPFIDDRQDIDWSSVQTTNKYNKIDANKIEINISFEVFENLCRLWDNQFNNFSSFEKRKAIADLMSLSGLVSTHTPKPYKVSDVENTLKAEYNVFKQKPIEIEIITNDSLVNCDYYLIFKPTSALAVDVEFVPVDIFNKMDQSKLEKYFYFAIKIPLSRLQDGVESDTDKKKPTVLTLDGLQLPVATKIITYSNYVLADINAHFLASKITPEGIDPTEVFSTYEKMSKFITESSADNNSEDSDSSSNNSAKKDKKDKKEYYFYKEWGSKALMCLTEVSSKKMNPHGEGYFVKLKKTFIYSGIFFPIYLKLEVNSFLAFYACEDSKKRSRYGFFSNDFLGDNLKKDEPLFDDFNAFFVYDFISEIKQPIISKGELDIPDFSDS